MEGRRRANLLKKKEDPRRRINFSFGLHSEISVGVVIKWRRKSKKIVGF